MINKKELRKAFKEKIPPKGIFCIKNNINGKVFLASSMNLHGILDSQRMQLSTKNYLNSALQKDWNEFGQEAFTFEILEEMKVKDDGTTKYDEELEILEAIWLEKFQPLSEKTYNKNEKIRIV